jgi:hypothetical protein
VRLPAASARLDRVADLERLALDLHESFAAVALPVRIAEQESFVRLGWELFDDPQASGKLLIVRFLDPTAAGGSRLAGKLGAVLRPRLGGGILVDCTNPFHGASLRPAYQRQGLVGGFLRDVVLARLPARSGVRAAVGPGTAAGVALEFFRAYTQQRRGPEWLESPAGRDWWRGLPENDALDWDAAGGYPPIFGLLRKAGLRLSLDEPGIVLGMPAPGADEQRRPPSAQAGDPGAAP